ncbi:hypothetical protein M8C21_017802, partial [Ambrosia artemisiifolia]
KDPSPRIASLGRRVLSIIGIEQVVTKSAKSTSTSGVRVGESSTTTSSLAGLARSSSWFDMNGGSSHLPLTFRTPPVSPPRPSYMTGIRRVCSLEFRPHLMDSGLADSLLGSHGVTGSSDRSFLPQSTIYNWSCSHFSKPLLIATDEADEIANKREDRETIVFDHITKCQPGTNLHNPIARWDTKFESGARASLLQPFAPIVVAADEGECIRYASFIFYLFLILGLLFIIKILFV